MENLKEKITLLVDCSLAIQIISSGFRDCYISRVFGRGIFLYLDSFLKLAPILKNEYKNSADCNKTVIKTIHNSILSLKNDYENNFSNIRHKIAAHKQQYDLYSVIEDWNKIDNQNVVSLVEREKEIWQRLEMIGQPSLYAISAGKLHRCFDQITSSFHSSKPSVGFDRQALARPNTVGFIPNGMFQMKPMLILSAFDSFQEVGGLADILRRRSDDFIVNKVVLDLLVTDGCSVIDNLYGFHDCPTNETTLIEIWQCENVSGTQTLAGFKRDYTYEESLRYYRNKCAAHFDGKLPFKELESRVVKFDIGKLGRYIGDMKKMFSTACVMDVRTDMFASHGKQLKGVVDIENPGTNKPYL